MASETVPRNRKNNRMKNDAETQEADAIASKDLLDVFGYNLPILADLKEGWYLVAHPNGPAIAKKYGFDFIGSLAHPCDEVPEGIRNEAVWQLMKWAKKQPSWPASNILREPSGTDGSRLK